MRRRLQGSKFVGDSHLYSEHAKLLQCFQSSTDSPVFSSKEAFDVLNDKGRRGEAPRLHRDSSLQAVIRRGRSPPVTLTGLLKGYLYYQGPLPLLRLSYKKHRASQWTQLCIGWGWGIGLGLPQEMGTQLCPRLLSAHPFSHLISS